MDIVYYCKRCNAYMGSLDAAKASEERLGFSMLTPEERTEFLRYDGSKNTLYVKTLCERCEHQEEQILLH
nr:DUF2757 family protein [Bacilli bacterium]